MGGQQRLKQGGKVSKKATNSCSGSCRNRDSWPKSHLQGDSRNCCDMSTVKSKIFWMSVKVFTVLKLTALYSMGPR